MEMIEYCINRLLKDKLLVARRRADMERRGNKFLCIMNCFPQLIRASRMGKRRYFGWTFYKCLVPIHFRNAYEK